MPPLLSALKISIVTACFNSEATIGRTLAAVDAQVGTFSVEHLVQDGGSTDGTMDLVAQYRDRADHAVLAQSERDAGFYDAINKAIRRATGDVVGLLNADDFYPSKDVLASVSQAFEADPATEAVYADLRYVRVPDGAAPGAAAAGGATGADRAESSLDLVGRLAPGCRVTRRWDAGPMSLARFRNGWMPPHPTVYVRRSVYERLGAYRLDMGTAADYEWLLRVFAKHRAPAVHLRKVTVYMLVGGLSNASLASRLKANRMDAKAWRVNGLLPYPWFPAAKPLRKLGQFVRRG